ncbi:MAG: recombination protein RecR [Candidatus Harrisonbacteria bacterium]|nr:recombination protein RecR [Candidatus Harrisonbacteria bacterium]
MLPDPIKNFVTIFSKLPSIGPRQATRLAFYISGLGKTKVKEIADAIAELNTLITCARCFRTFTPPRAGQAGSGKLCSICSDPTRLKNLIAIVEKETDLLSLEKTKKFTGWYLVIGELHKNGELEPEQKLRLSSLKSFIQKELGGKPSSAETTAGKAEEIILATNPTVYGDLNAATLKKELEGLAKKITRLGRGIPTGGEIEFADEETLGQALERRN